MYCFSRGLYPFSGCNKKLLKQQKNWNYFSAIVHTLQIYPVGLNLTPLPYAIQALNVK